MECNREQFSSTLEKALSLPPPLPAHLNTIIFCQKSKIKGYSCVPNALNNPLDRLFDEGYRSDVLILTDDGCVIYAHASILGVASPVFMSMLKQLKRRGNHHKRTISIRGIPSEAVRVFIRFLYSSCYEEQDMNQFALPLLVLSHAYVVPRLKRLCECCLEKRLITIENAVDIFQLALLCDAPRLSFVCHRFIQSNFKSISASEGWKVMKESHPILESEVLDSIIIEEVRQKDQKRKVNERKVYIQLYEAMEALVHICRDGCRTIGPHDKIIKKDDKEPFRHYVTTCKGLESLVRHFAVCKMRGPGGCLHCKRIWQILELHSWLCADSDACRVPLCRNFRERRRKQTKKEDIRWKILAKKIVRSNSISGAPFFSLESILL